MKWSNDGKKNYQNSFTMMSKTEDVRKPLLQAIAAKAGSTNLRIMSCA